MLDEVIFMMSPEEVEIADTYVKKIIMPKGSIIFEQFDMECDFYILVDGNVRLYQLTTLADMLCALEMGDIEAPDPVPLAEVDIFGSLMRSCTAVAATDVTLIHMPQENLMKLREEHPSVMLRFIEYAGEKLAFKHLNMVEQIQSRMLTETPNIQAIMLRFERYFGKMKICTPRTAKKLFRIEDPVM